MTEPLLAPERRAEPARQALYLSENEAERLPKRVPPGVQARAGVGHGAAPGQGRSGRPRPALPGGCPCRKGWVDRYAEPRRPSRQFRADAGSRELVLAASHRVADGQPIVWASRLAGTPVPERVPGSDLVLSLPEAAARAGVRVFLLGGNPGVAADAARRLQALNPELQHVGSYCPPFGFEDDPGALDRIKDVLRAARPTLVLVGLGFPKQERLIQTLRPEFPEAWFAGVGISLSFLTGDQSRAPTRLQRLGLELGRTASCMSLAASSGDTWCGGSPSASCCSAGALAHRLWGN